MTIELLDTDSETREGSEAEGENGGKAADGGGKDGGGDDSTTPHQSSHAYLADFLSSTGGGMKISDEARAHLNLKPVFLRRSVRQYRKRNRHKLVPRPQQAPPSSSAGDAAATTNAATAATTTEATKTTVTLNNDASSTTKTGEKSEER